MDYDNALELIKKVEVYSTEQKSVKINLMDFEEKIPLKEYNYREVASIVNFVERVEATQLPGAGRYSAPPSALPAQEQTAKPPARVEMPSEQIAHEEHAPLQSAHMQQPIPQPPARMQQPVQAPKPSAPVVKKLGIMKGVGAAAAEFGEALSHLEGTIGSMTEKKSDEKLVLPNLSINDQVSELEKINFGIDGNVFDKEQLDIIKLEVGGLAKATRRHKAPSDADRELVELRDKRLKEVLSKLGLK